MTMDCPLRSARPESTSRVIRQQARSLAICKKTRVIAQSGPSSVVNNYQKSPPNILLMKPAPTLPRSPHAVHKWANERRVQIWEMIEKLGKGEVSYKEARELLREEKKALHAVSKRVFGFKTNLGSNLIAAAHSTRTPKP